MATKRKTTKKQTVTEPIIVYVDPEKNLEAEPEVAEQEVPNKEPTFIATAESVKGLEHYFVDDADDLFACMKRRRDKEK